MFLDVIAMLGFVILGVQISPVAAQEIALESIRSFSRLARQIVTRATVSSKYEAI